MRGTTVSVRPHGALSDLEAAVAAGRESLNVLPRDDDESWMNLSNVAMAHLRWFSHTNELADLAEADDLLRRSLTAVPGIDSRRASALALLCSCLLRAFRHGRDPALLDEAITVGFESLALSAKRDEHYAQLLDDLIDATQTRFAYLGDLADINAAFNRASKALSATDWGSPQYGRNWVRRGVVARVRFEGFGRINDLTASVEFLRSGEHPAESGDERAHRLSELSVSLQLVYTHSHDLEALDKAIDAGRAAVQAAEDSNPNRLDHIANLAAALTLRSRTSADHTLLDEAVDLFARAVELSRDSVDRAQNLINLATALRDRYDLRGERDDRDAAIAAWREAALSPDALPDVRIGPRAVRG